MVGIGVINDFPAVKYLGKGKWRLEDEFVFWSRYGKIVVPKGFVTDFASVPPLPLAYLLTKNASKVGAATHDFLYREGKIDDYKLTRQQADDLMCDLMILEGVTWWQRRMIRFGLRIGGWWTWNKYRKADKAAT